MKSPDTKPPISETLVLCGHPLSEEFRAALQEKLGACRQITLAALKARGPVFSLAHLARERSSAVYVVYEEPEEALYLPVMCLSALLVRAPRRFVVDPDLAARKLTFAYALKSLVGVALGSVAALYHGVRAAIDLAWLRNAGPARVSVPRNWGVVYLNANIMFGVKAGGSLGHIAGVVNDLHARKADVLYVATSRSSVIDHAVPMQRLTLPALLGFPLELFLFGLGRHAIGQLRPLFERKRPAIIYQRMARCNYTGAVLSRRHGVPLVMEYNGSEAWAGRHWGRRMIFERLAHSAELASLRTAHVVVTVSDVLAEELVALGIERSRIVVYPNCVDSAVFDASRFDAERLAAFRASRGIPAGALVAGFIGTFGKWHGIDVLCDTVRILAHENARWLDEYTVRFLLVGDGHGRALVEELLRDPLCAKYVVWPGLVAQKEAPLYLAAMDILLSPHVPNPDGSRFFGSPTKLFEYMSMQRPIVASGLDQIADVLTPSLSASALPDGPPGSEARELAILTRPGDREGLASSIRFLAECAQWRRVLAANARTEVLRQYQWSHHVDRIISAIDGLVTEDPTPSPEIVPEGHLRL